MMHVFMSPGPGRTCPNAKVVVYSSAVTQALFSTAMKYMEAEIPPKPKSPTNT
jgi:hypothetical protein